MTSPDMTGPDAASTDEGIGFFVSYTRSPLVRGHIGKRRAQARGGLGRPGCPQARGDHPAKLDELGHEINQTIDLIQAQVQGPRRDQWWAWADLGLVCQLGGRAREARGAYEHFQQAGARPVDYKSVLDVLESLSATFEPSVPDLAARLGETVQTLQASSGGA
jgi:hypothetical protein